MSGRKSVSKVEIREAEFKFLRPNTRLFITGAALSGKSTIAPLITSYIQDCTLQNMDIIRLLAQTIENQKQKVLRNPFVEVGSCDAFTLINNGTFSPKSLVEGFNQYSQAVSSLLGHIVPKLETQGAKNVIFEGVQLTPSIVTRYINQASRLIVVTSTKNIFTRNAKKMFRDKSEQSFLERYSPDKLLLIQNELLRQTKDFPQNKLFIVENTGSVKKAVQKIISYLITSKVVTPLEVSPQKTSR